MADSIDTYAEQLDEDGIVIIEDYFEDDKANEYAEAIKKLIDKGSLTRKEDLFDDDYTTGDLKNAETAFLNVRTGRDEGMHDIFNIDMEIEELREFKNDDFILEIINKTSKSKLEPENLNAYWKESVTETRGFHVDSYVEQFKSFVYLTDVESEAQGPFSYIRGSHRHSYLKENLSEYINKILGNPSTDALFYNQSNEVKCIAPRGTLIIANQSGYHRGVPQARGARRLLLTTSYKKK